MYFCLWWISSSLWMSASLWTSMGCRDAATSPYAAPWPAGQSLPWCLGPSLVTDLGVCRVDCLIYSHSTLLWVQLLLHNNIFHLFKYVIAEVLSPLGPLLAAAGWSILDSSGIGFVQHRGSFWQLLTEATPVVPLLLPKTCHTNPIHNVRIKLMFGSEEENSFAAGYLGRLSLHEQHRHDLCRSPTGIIHAHLILLLPSLFWCFLRLQHFILPCASEDNIFIFSKALIHPKLS